MFWKKQTNSEEYERLLKKLAEMRHDLEALHSKIASLQTNYDDLRGKFNRKLYKMSADDETAAKSNENSQESKILNTLNPFKI